MRSLSVMPLWLHLCLLPFVGLHDLVQEIVGVHGTHTGIYRRYICCGRCDSALRSHGASLVLAAALQPLKCVHGVEIAPLGDELCRFVRHYCGWTRLYCLRRHDDYGHHMIWHPMHCIWRPVKWDSCL